jgi:thymidine phosphorylase
VFKKKIGDSVQRGERICAIHYNDPVRAARAIEMILSAITISAQPVRPPSLILEFVS